ncbi:MAG: UDP-N-acetylmuramate dehydrogenase [Parcubacteria group bacterium]
MPDILSRLHGLDVKTDEPLSRHTTFRIGGPARFFVSMDNKQDLYKCLNAARELKMSFLILGGGSNVLISDSGFDGIVIKMNAGEINIVGNKLTVFSGNNLGAMIREAIENKLSGLEFAANIPGTVGGAIRGNVGTNGMSVGDFVDSVEALEISADAVNLKKLTKEQCAFEYRDSIFNKNSNWIITEATFNLIADENSTDKLDAIKNEMQNRIANQPYDLPSAGCVFKNVSLRGPANCWAPQRDITDLTKWAINDKIPVGKLIEETGLKGKRIGGAMISEKHANFIVNVENAKASDVMALIDLIKKMVREKFGVDLEEEIVFIGKFN